jgi:hypothetical protein
MQITIPILDQWSQVRSLLPSGFDVEASARARGAFTRSRGVKDAETLLRLALGYGACGMSLRESCAWAESTGLAHVSDPALIKRLDKAADWLGDLVGALLAEQAAVPVPRWAGYRLRAIDATTICEPGADRTTWRLHAGYDLASGQMDRLELTDNRGAESLERFSFRPGDIALADRGYARPRDLRPVLDAGADLIVRTGWNSLRLSAPDGSLFDLFAALRTLAAPQGEHRVAIYEGAAACDGALVLRLVILRKSPKDAAEARVRVRKEASKRGKQPDPRSLEAADYILLLTSLPADTFPTADVLALYRLRWQIELAFKRFKSIAGLDDLPAKKPGLAKAWIYGRLIAILLAERIAGKFPDSPPWADPKTRAKPVAMAKHEDDSRQLARRRSRAAPLEDNHRRLHSPTPFPL